MSRNSTSIGFGLILICLVIGVVCGCYYSDSIADVIREITPQPPNPC